MSPIPTAAFLCALLMAFLVVMCVRFLHAFEGSLAMRAKYRSLRPSPSRGLG